MLQKIEELFMSKKLAHSVFEKYLAGTAFITFMLHIATY